MFVMGNPGYLLVIDESPGVLESSGVLESFEVLVSFREAWR